MIASFGCAFLKWSMIFERTSPRMEVVWQNFWTD